ncbi:MAG: 3-isopropylmalate dehydratase small subunit [Pseudomonadota bacterium]
MRPFSVHNGVVAPLRRDNIDTDAIIPSREMKRVSKSGLGIGMFAAWRYADNGRDKDTLVPDFVLNQPAYAETTILLGGTNFGCGSSREHAVWALTDYGIRVVIAPSFGAIFQRNCYRNGLLAIELAEASIDAIEAATAADPQKLTVTVDLTAGRIVTAAGEVDFSISSEVRERLLSGADDIDLTLRYADEIAAFREARYADEPWADLTDGAVPVPYGHEKQR